MVRFPHAASDEVPVFEKNGRFACQGQPLQTDQAAHLHRHIGNGFDLLVCADVKDYSNAPGVYSVGYTHAQQQDSLRGSPLYFWTTTRGVACVSLSSTRHYPRRKKSLRNGEWVSSVGVCTFVSFVSLIFSGTSQAKHLFL